MNSDKGGKKSRDWMQILLSQQKQLKATLNNLHLST